MIKRILVDLNQSARFYDNTGIARVLKNIIINLQKKSVDNNIEVLPFYNIEGKCYLVSEPFEKLQELTNKEIILQSGDYILILDSIFFIWKNHFDFYLKAKQMGIPISLVKYDYIPIEYPHFFQCQRFVELFKEFVNLFVLHIVDNVICISKTVADETINYCNKLKSPNPNIFYWKLGCNYEKLSLNKTHNTFENLLKEKPYLLMVGTIQPGKNYRMALDSMSEMWRNGSDLCLVIAGKNGWKSEDVMYDILNHTEYNKKLFFIDNPTDGDLTHLYQGCKALLQLSIIEGFGLPIIEASYHNKQIICSDIPIFREVAGEFATFVKLNVDDIIEKINHWHKNNIKIDSSKIKKVTWEESCEELLSVINQQKPYIKSTKDKKNFEDFMKDLIQNVTYNNWYKSSEKAIKVMSLYHKLLKRPPDNYSYNNFIDSDLSIEEIEKVIIESEEYIEVNNINFVKNKKLLMRVLDKR